MGRPLIINADDFGLSEGTNAGIIACHQAGSVSSTTLMVTMPSAQASVELAKINANLGVGLHFNLTLGAPASPAKEVTSLVDEEGNFYGRSAFEQRAVFGKIRPHDVAVELEAQMRLFEDFGLAPTHLDSHQHVHLLPGVFDVVAEFCVERGLPLRMPWVWPHSTGVSMKKLLRQRFLKTLIKRHMSRWSAALQTNKAFASVFDIGPQPDAIAMESYRRLLSQNDASLLELMVHPARVDTRHRESTIISAISEREYAVLSSNNLGEVAKSLGYTLTHYGKAFVEDTISH